MSFVDQSFLKHQQLLTVQLPKTPTMFACSSVALATSCYLAWASLTSSPVAGCGGGSMFDCSHVLHSRWSSVLSIPVSIPAIAVHLLVLTCLLLNPISKGWQQARWAVIGFAALSSAAAAIWFIGLQVLWIEHLCPYCLVAHAAGLTLSMVFLWNCPLTKVELLAVSGLAIASTTGLIVLQSLNVTPQSYEVITYPDPKDGDAPNLDDALLFEPPKPQASLIPRRLNDQLIDMSGIVALVTNPVAANMASTIVYLPDDGPIKVDKPSKSALILSSLRLETNAWPLLGKQDAEKVFVEMFDYTCEHCQRTHKALEGVREKYGDRLAIIALPVPIDGKCNPNVKVTEASHIEACELAKLAIAVWSIDKEKFAEFHHYLFTSKPKYEQAKTKAKELVDADKLTELLKTSLPGDYIAKHVAIYQKAGAGNIPKLMFPRSTSVGAIESTDVIMQLIEQHLK